VSLCVCTCVCVVCAVCGRYVFMCVCMFVRVCVCKSVCMCLRYVVCVCVRVPASKWYACGECVNACMCYMCATKMPHIYLHISGRLFTSMSVLRCMHMHAHARVLYLQYEPCQLSVSLLHGAIQPLAAPHEVDKTAAGQHSRQAEQGDERGNARGSACHSTCHLNYRRSIEAS